MQTRHYSQDEPCVLNWRTLFQGKGFHVIRETHFLALQLLPNLINNNGMHVFLQLTSVAYFPALGIAGMFSSVWHPWHVFRCLTSVACFPALDISGMFPRAWHHWHVFPRLSSLECFPALDITAFLRLAPAAVGTCWFITLRFYCLDWLHRSFISVSLWAPCQSLSAFTMQAAIWSSDTSFDQRKNYSKRNVSIPFLRTRYNSRYTTFLGSTIAWRL